MPQPPIIGSSGSYNNPRGNPRHGRTASGQAFQNVNQSVGNAYLLENIAAGAEGEVRFIDRATSEIDTVMTPITAKNIGQVDFDKSSIVTYFRLPGISTPLLLVGEANNPDSGTLPPLGSISPNDFINVVEMLDDEIIDLTSDLGFFLSFSDPDPGGDGSGDYTVTMLSSAGGFTITPGDSGTTDTTPVTPPPHNYQVTGTLDELNALFSNQTTGTVTTSVAPNTIATWTIGIVAPDGRSSGATYHVVGWKSVAAFIENNMSIYVRTTGDDTTGDGSTGNPYLTVQKAFDTLTDKRISPSATVSIIVGDGAFAESSLVMKHPDSARITLSGENLPTTTVSSIQSSSGAAGAWSIILNVASVANIAVGDYIQMLAPTGGTLPTYLAGCHVVTNRDATNTRITITSTHKKGTAPSGSVTGTIQIFKTRLTFASGNGLTINPNITMGTVSNIVFVGAAASIGLSVTGGFAQITNCGFSNWATGVFPSRCGEVIFTASSISNCTSAGALVYTNGLFNGGTTSVISGCATGVAATYNGNSINDSELITGCDVALFCSTAGRIQAASARVTGCTGIGVQCFFAGAIYASAITVDRCATGLEADSGGIVYAASATITNNTGFGVYALTNGMIVVTSATFTGNGGTANFFFDTIQRDGANIISSPFFQEPELGWFFDYRLANDLTITNQAEQDVPGLSWIATAGEVWEIEMRGVASGSDATGDAAVNLMTTGTWVAARSNYQGTSYNGAAALTATAATAFSSTTRMVATTGLPVANGGTGVDYPFKISALVTVDGTGTMKMVFGNAAAAVGRTSTLRAGARLVGRKIR